MEVKEEEEEEEEEAADDDEEEDQDRETCLQRLIDLIPERAQQMGGSMIEIPSQPTESHHMGAKVMLLGDAAHTQGRLDPTHRCAYRC